MKPRLLITGVSGLLGGNLAWCLRHQYQLQGTYCRNSVNLPDVECHKVDLCDSDAVGHLLKEIRPEIIIHCAAMARPDECEKKPRQATKLNIIATQELAQQVSKKSCKFIYISSDTVYDGKKGNFCEKDPVGPLSHYAQTKLEGEQAALSIDRALAVRINIFGWNICQDQCFAEQILSELSEGRRVKGFDDVRFSAMYTLILSELLQEMINKDLSGVYNLASSSCMSKYEFACRIAQEAGLDTSLIDSVSVVDMGFTAPRSKDLSMDVAKLSMALKRPIPNMTDSIKRFVTDWRNGIEAAMKHGQRNLSKGQVT